jgi:cell division septum initiation protein DivIVA
MDRLDRKDLSDAAFDVVLRGYDKRQVDERLRFLGAELMAVEDARWAADQRVAMLEEALNRAQSPPNGEPSAEVNFGARVEKILKLAEDEASEVRNQAEAAAVNLVDQARAQVAELRQRAEQEIAAWRTEANREAAEQDDALRRRFSELDSTRHEVERDRIAADQLVAQARTEAERLVAAAAEAAQQRERSSAHELHQLSRLQEEINGDLYRVKDLLDSLFGAGGAVTGVIRHKLPKDGAQPTQAAHTV